MGNIVKVTRFFGAKCLAPTPTPPSPPPSHWENLSILITESSFYLIVFNNFHTFDTFLIWVTIFHMALKVFETPVFNSWFHEISTKRPRLNVVLNLVFTYPTFFPELSIKKIMFKYAKNYKISAIFDAILSQYLIILFNTNNTWIIYNFQCSLFHFVNTMKQKISLRFFSVHDTNQAQYTHNCRQPFIITTKVCNLFELVRFKSPCNAHFS